MTNTSATGGYLRPTDVPLPGNLSLEDFIHDVLVGITGLDDDLVRPRWQKEPPKQPDIDSNWLAFGITMIPSDDNAYQDQQDDKAVLSRQVNLDVLCSFYGPDCESLAAQLRDGFQITQNLEALILADMGYQTCSTILRVPQLTNERYIDRVDITVTLVREIKREYAILPLVSAEGNIETDTNPQIIIPWTTINES